MPIKKGDFVEITYTGCIAETGMVFDTTDEKLAKEAGLGHAHFGPQVICIGERHVLPGLDDRIAGSELGEHSWDIPAAEGFGKKDSKLIELIPISTFTKQKIMPVQGMQLNVDGQLGVVKVANGGRVLVDFNHPLAGKNLKYTVTINKIVTDPKTKIKALLDILLHTHTEIPVGIENEEAIVEIPAALPGEVASQLSERMAMLTGLRKVSFISPRKSEKAAKNLNKEP